MIQMVLVKRLERMTLRNDFIFGFTDTILEFIPHKRTLGDSHLVGRELNNIIDRIILNNGSIKIKLDRNLSHDRDIYWDYLNGYYHDPSLSQLLKTSLKLGVSLLT